MNEEERRLRSLHRWEMAVRFMIPVVMGAVTALAFLGVVTLATYLAG